MNVLPERLSAGLLRHGWRLRAHPLFLQQVERLLISVRHLRCRAVEGWQHDSNAKLLAALRNVVLEQVPRDVSATTRATGASASNLLHRWLSIDFGDERFRLFFKVYRDDGIILYAWIDDRGSSRGSRFSNGFGPRLANDNLSVR